MCLCVSCDQAHLKDLASGFDSLITTAGDVKWNIQNRTALVGEFKAALAAYTSALSAARSKKNSKTEEQVITVRSLKSRFASVVCNV